MKTRKEIRDWLLENAVDECGYLDLSHLDFSNFDNTVLINNMKVKETLFQSFQEVGGNLYQNSQQVKEDLYQECQEVGNDLYQNAQIVQGNFITQSLKLYEEYRFDRSKNTYIVKKDITTEQLKEIIKNTNIVICQYSGGVQMKTIEETKQWLLENRVDEDGNLDLRSLDFSDFNGDVFIDNMKVKKDLYQSSQEVQGNFITQTLKDNEEYEINEYGDATIVKKEEGEEE